MRYRIIPVTPFQQNCALIWDEHTMQGALVDPGGDGERLIAAAQHEGVILTKLLLTHGHIDHAGGAAALAVQLGIPIEGPHQADAFLLDSLPQQSQMYGFPPAAAVTPQRWLAQGDTVGVGQVTLEVLHCPGHTPGHVAFFERATATAFVGDVLFKGSIGRTDFPRGDYDSLIRSIRERLFPLGDEVTFVPGHGPLSTFGHERRSNPFVAD